MLWPNRYAASRRLVGDGPSLRFDPLGAVLVAALGGRPFI